MDREHVDQLDHHFNSLWISWSKRVRGFSFNYDENPSKDQRVGTIVVTSPGAQDSPQILAVTQNGAGGGSITVTSVSIPPSATAGEDLFFGWTGNSSVDQQVLEEWTLYPAGQTDVRFDLVHNFTIHVGAGFYSGTLEEILPTDIYSGVYDVEVSLWNDANGNFVIDAGDILEGSFKQDNAIVISGIPTPTPTPSPALGLSTHELDVAADPGGATPSSSQIPAAGF